jgi:hypothetical protein
MPENTTEAAARLAAAGITWTATTWREQHRPRFVDPHNPIQWITHHGLLVTFTGTPEDRETRASTDTFRMRLNPLTLRQLIDALPNLGRAGCEKVVLAEDHEASGLLRAGNAILTTVELRWDRTILGPSSLPVTPPLLEDLRTCLAAEAALLALSGGHPA